MGYKKDLEVGAKMTGIIIGFFLKYLSKEKTFIFFF